MCGPDNSNRPRGGALVALNSPTTYPQGLLRGDLAFHTPGSADNSNATHARLTPSEAWDMTKHLDLQVVIHSSGDLTRNACDCGLFRRIALPATAAMSPGHEHIEFPLDMPLSLEVGNEGIIGRRVSVYSQEKIIAEGIVGFNFLT